MDLIPTSTVYWQKLISYWNHLKGLMNHPLMEYGNYNQSQR